jgi:hypothetical protein
MPRYLIRALRQLQVSDSTRQPGELVPEAAEWPNLRHYESLSWVERVPVPNDYSGEGAVEYPPAAPTSKLAEVLEPEREPTPVVVAWTRKTGASVAIRCVNCRVRNWLPNDFLETAVWMCWDCAQPQTTVQAREHPSPTSFEEWLDSRNARSEDLTAAWSPGAGVITDAPR